MNYRQRSRRSYRAKVAQTKFPFKPKIEEELYRSSFWGVGRGRDSPPGTTPVKRFYSTVKYKSKFEAPNKLKQTDLTQFL